jgi:hypothetical protein
VRGIQPLAPRPKAGDLSLALILPVQAAELLKIHKLEEIKLKTPLI